MRQRNEKVTFSAQAWPCPFRLGFTPCIEIQICGKRHIISVNYALRLTERIMQAARQITDDVVRASHDDPRADAVFEEELQKMRAEKGESE